LAAFAARILAKRSFLDRVADLDMVVGASRERTFLFL
jgi:hypothetical protein